MTTRYSSREKPPNDHDKNRQIAADLDKLPIEVLYAILELLRARHRI